MFLRLWGNLDLVKRGLELERGAFQRRLGIGGERKITEGNRSRESGLGTLRLC